MKRRLTRLIPALLCILFLYGCEGLYPPAEKERHMILCYFSSHDNQLSGASAEAINSIRNGELPPAGDDSKVLLIYYHLTDSIPVLSRFSKDGEGRCVEEVLMHYPAGNVVSTLSLSPEQIRQVWRDAQALFPSVRQSLMISSHGSGYLPTGYLSNPEDCADIRESDPFRHLVKSSDGSRSVGPDDGIEIEIPALVSALSGIHFDFILFDCCYMGGIEVAYQVKDICDYVIASPTEVMAKGIICGELIQPSFNGETAGAVRSVCENYMERVRSDAEFRKSGCIAAVKTSELPELASVCSDIYSSRRSYISGTDSYSVQGYFRNKQHWFYDLDDFIHRICTNEDGTEDEAYGSFCAALGKAVVFKDTTPAFLEVPITSYSGLSTYIPRAKCPSLNNYYKTLEWNKATGFIR